MDAIESLQTTLTGARCWGLELDARYRVLAVTVEPDPTRALGTAGEQQLLCFPVSVLLVTLTRTVRTDEGPRTVLETFDLEQLTAVSERLGGAVIAGPPFGAPEPRPGAWGPRHSLEGRSSAADGVRRTLTLDLADEDARLRVFARFDDVELRDAARTRLLGTSDTAPTTAPAGGSEDGGSAVGPGASEAGTRPDDDPAWPLRF